jgi:hypothetical protein
VRGEWLHSAVFSSRDSAGIPVLQTTIGKAKEGLRAANIFAGVDWHSSEIAFPMKDRDRLFLARTDLFRLFVVQILNRHPGFFWGSRWDTRNDGFFITRKKSV